MTPLCLAARLVDGAEGPLAEELEQLEAVDLAEVAVLVRHVWHFSGCCEAGD